MPAVTGEPGTAAGAPTAVDPTAAVVDPTAPVDPGSAVAKPVAPAKGKAGDKGKDAKKTEKKDMTDDELYPFTDITPDSSLMPAKFSSHSDHIDEMFYIIVVLSIFSFVTITIAVVYLVWRYRHREGYRAEPSKAHDNVLEVTWTVIPSILCVFIFLGGWQGYLKMTTPPANALDIEVIGKKWNWVFTYTKDQDVLENQNVLHVPVGRAIKLTMRSEDVVHSFFVPAARLKQDVIPGRYTYLSFIADKPGVYKVYCAEYCGDAHSDMKTRVVVHESGGYEKWLQEAIDAEKVDCKEAFGDDAEAMASCYQSQGEKLYTRMGCKQCHSTDGSAGTGPTFQGMWAKSRNFTDGSTGVVDENYIRESVLDPMAKVRSGFSPVMPTFKGKLKDKDVDALIHWMKGLQ